MIAAIAGSLIATAGLGVLAWAWLRERTLRRRAQAEASRLRIRLADAAEMAALAIRGEARTLAPVPGLRTRRRHRPSRYHGLIPAALIAAWGRAREHQGAVGAALAATTLAGLAAVPLILPADPQPRPAPPLAAAPPPVVQDPGLPAPAAPAPVPEPEPEVAPPAGGSQPAADGPNAAPTEAPELDRVAVELPAVPELPAVAPPPPATPPAPAPAPEPTEAVPSPVPEPEPEATETTADPLLLCADVEMLGAVELELCI